MKTKVFVTRLSLHAREGLKRQALANGRTMSGEARVIIEDALGVDRAAMRTGYDGLPWLGEQQKHGGA
jgi:hypothetical protein